MPGAKIDCILVPHLIICQQGREDRAGKNMFLYPSFWKCEDLVIGEWCSSGELATSEWRTWQHVWKGSDCCCDLDLEERWRAAVACWGCTIAGCGQYWDLGANSAKHPSPEQVLLCTKQCHLLGGVRTMPWGSALQRFRTLMCLVHSGSAVFFNLCTCFENETPEFERQC